MTRTSWLWSSSTGRPSRLSSNGRGRLSAQRASEIATGMAIGLEAAHVAERRHRHISPQNVMITASGEIKVTDFGVARDVTQASLTATSMLLGKPQYIAPEVVTGESRPDIRSDIYLLAWNRSVPDAHGARPVHRARTPYAIMQCGLRNPLATYAGVRSDIPEKLVRIVEKCLAKQPEERYQTPRDLLSALEDPSPRLVDQANLSGRPAPASARHY